jgi:four helix bundle protein
MPQDIQDLTVWHRAMDMTVCIYQLTKEFPKDETYGLVSQLRRASVSVASNIAEGQGKAEFRRISAIPRDSSWVNFRDQDPTYRR